MAQGMRLYPNLLDVTTSAPLNAVCPKTNQAPRNAWLNTDLIALTGTAGYLRFTLRVNETAFSTEILIVTFKPC